MEAPSKLSSSQQSLSWPGTVLISGWVSLAERFWSRARSTCRCCPVEASWCFDFSDLTVFATMLEFCNLLYKTSDVSNWIIFMLLEEENYLYLVVLISVIISIYLARGLKLPECLTFVWPVQHLDFFWFHNTGRWWPDKIVSVKKKSVAMKLLSNEYKTQLSFMQSHLSFQSTMNGNFEPDRRTPSSPWDEWTSAPVLNFQLTTKQLIRIEN